MFLYYPDFGIWKWGHLFYRRICPSGALCFPGILNVIMEDGGWCSQTLHVDSSTSMGLCFLTSRLLAKEVKRTFQNTLQINIVSTTDSMEAHPLELEMPRAEKTDML